MRKKRREFSAAFKASEVIEVPGNRKILAEASKRYEVHPKTINKWNQEFLQPSSEVFELKCGYGSGIVIKN
jgi:transposase